MCVCDFSETKEDLQQIPQRDFTTQSIEPHFC